MAEISFNIPSFNGAKTYLCAAAGIATLIGHSLGYVPDPVANTLYGLFGFGGLAAMRAGVTKSTAPPNLIPDIVNTIAPLIQSNIQNYTISAGNSPPDDKPAG